MEVSGSINGTIGSHGWLDYKGTLASVTGKENGSSNSGNFSIWATEDIVANQIKAFSDIRIKNIEGISHSKSDLETLMKIEVTDYRMKDTISKGTKPIKKVIAQQIAEVYPQAVTANLTEVVPDIYQRADVADGWIMLTTDLKIGERVKIISEKSAEVYEVIEVESDRFKVSTSEPDAWAKVFVYGREVDDFHTVDYEAISMLNVSATQELKRMIDQQKTQIESQKTKIEILETRLNEELSAIKTMLETQDESHSSLPQIDR